MAIKNVWMNKKSKWKQIDTRANRKTLLWIKRNAPNRKIFVSDIEKNLEITRDSALKRLVRLHQAGFLRMKRISNRKIRDNKEYWLSKKGKIQMPRKKIKEIKVIEKIIEKEVPIGKLKRRTEDVVGIV